jgi:hypothetical protein
MALVRRDAAGHDSHRVGRGLPAIKGSCARSLRLRNNLRACRSPGAGMEIAFLWFAFAIVVGVAASARGRNGIGWFVLALIISTLKATSVGGLFHFNPLVHGGLCISHWPIFNLRVVLSVFDRSCPNLNLSVPNSFSVQTRVCRIKVS